MKIRLFVAAVFLAIVGPILGFQDRAPSPPAPTIHAVVEWNFQTNALVYEAIVNQAVPVTKEIVIEMDGVKRKSVVTELQLRTVKRQSSRSFKECKFTTAEGKILTADQASKLAPGGTLVIIASWGEKVDPAYLKILKPDTLVVLTNSAAVPR